MGWLKWSMKDSNLSVLDTKDCKLGHSQLSDHKDEITHIERLDLSDEQVTVDPISLHRHYPLLPTSTSDAELPFISSDIIRSSKHDHLWLVIDDIVYDCAGFEHPGGTTVIESFRAENCSWQFWRFHNKKHMQEHGRSLRIGRTSDVPNRFKEPPKFVGLRRLGADDW